MTVRRSTVAQFCEELFGTPHVVSASFAPAQPPAALVVARDWQAGGSLAALLGIDAAEVQRIDVDRQGATILRRGRDAERIDFEDT